MQQILTLQAEEGMVLAKEVEVEGRVLCGKGTELTGKIIDRFQKMDVVHITVEGHPVQVEGEKSLKEELRAMEKRFSRVKNVPPLTYLKKKLMQKLVISRRQ